MKRMGPAVALGLAFIACSSTPGDGATPLAPRPVLHARAMGAPRTLPGPVGVRNLSTPPDTGTCPTYPGGPPVLYSGGPVLASVNVVPVFWGSSVNATTVATIPGFLGAIVNSSYMDWLTEYSTFPGTNQVIGRGTATTAFPIKPINKSLSLTDLDIGAEIKKQISAGSLPASVANTTLYMLYMPSGMTVTQAGQTSCKDFCSYHSDVGSSPSTLHYGVIMDPSCCPTSGLTAIEVTELDSSHELIESVTDPELTSWTTTDAVRISDPDCSELADICSSQAVLLPNSSTAVVSAIWSHRTNSCVTNVSIPTAGNPSSYSRVSFVQSEPTRAVSSVNYRGPGDNAKELSLSSASGSGWTLNNLSATAQPKGPTAASDLATYARADGVNSVVYRASSNDIYELQLLPGEPWKAVDLMHSVTPTPPPATDDPGAYARSDGYDSVVYVGTDRHVHELAWVPTTAISTTLTSTDLTLASGAPANAVGDAFGYIRADGINVVVYRSSDNHIRELALVGGWGWGDLTVASGNAPAATSRPRGYARSDQVSAVVYQGTNDHIYELSLSPQATSWEVGDLTAITGAPSSASEPVPYVRTGGVNAVVFRDINKHIQELRLFEGSGWVVNDLTTLAGGAPAATGNPTAYIRSDGYNAVNFLASSNNDVIELYGGQTWGWGNLTTVSGGAL